MLVVKLSYKLLMVVDTRYAGRTRYASSADVAARQSDRMHGIDKNKNKTHPTHSENRSLRRQKQRLLSLITTGDFKHH